MLILYVRIMNVFSIVSCTVRLFLQPPPEVLGQSSVIHPITFESVEMEVCVSVWVYICVWVF